MNTCFYYLRINYPNSVWVKVTTCPDGWVVDKTKIMQCHLLTEVVVEVEDELGKNRSKVGARNEKMKDELIVSKGTNLLSNFGKAKPSSFWYEIE